MNKIIYLAALSLTASISVSALAAAPAGLNFRELEYAQPRDPLLASNQSADIEQHTSPAALSDASTALNAAIPAGTSRAGAEAILRRAGAHCAAQAGTSERCSYSDVETRDEYVDAVRWNVRLDLAGDRVDGVSVDRSWVRS